MPHGVSTQRDCGTGRTQYHFPGRSCGGVAADRPTVAIAAAVGQPFLSLWGEPITLPLPTDDPLPTRLSMADVQEVRMFTDHK